MFKRNRFKMAFSGLVLTLSLSVAFFSIKHAHSFTFNGVYQGCFTERGVRNFHSVANFSELTVDSCAETCASKGLPYLALKNPVCYCGSDSFNPGVFSNDCSLPCGGNPSQICGGPTTYSVYKSCSVWRSGINCSISDCHTCKSSSCNEEGACSRGCVQGFRGTKCERDVNECVYPCSQTRIENCHKCSDKCMNTIGGYNCTCPTGFQLRNDFECECPQGFQEVVSESRKTCVDVDECLQDNSTCDHFCNNTHGRYICSCREGYTLVQNKLCQYLYGFKDLNSAAIIFAIGVAVPSILFTVISIVICIKCNKRIKSTVKISRPTSNKLRKQTDAQMSRPNIYTEADTITATTSAADKVTITETKTVTKRETDGTKKGYKVTLEVPDVQTDSRCSFTSFCSEFDDADHPPTEYANLNIFSPMPGIAEENTAGAVNWLRPKESLKNLAINGASTDVNNEQYDDYYNIKYI